MREKCCLALITFSMRGDFMNTKLLTSILQSSNDLITSEDFLTRHRIGNAFTRSGKLSFSNLIYFVLQSVHKSIPINYARFLENFPSDLPIFVSKQAISKARQGISHKAFLELFRLSVKQFYFQPVNLRTWNGFHIYAVDGSTIQIPESKENYEVFGGNPNKTKIISPLASASVLYDVINDILIDVSLHPYRYNERESAKAHVDFLPRFPNSIILFDRGYPSEDMFHYLNSKGILFLMRVPKTFKKAISEQEDALFTYPASCNKESLTLRSIHFLLEDGSTEYLVTNLMPEQIAKENFPDLYQFRWGVESKYRELKNRLEIEAFNSIKPASIQQEFFAAMYLSNLVAVIKSESDSKIIVSINNRHAYQANRSYILNRIKNCIVHLLRLKSSRSKTFESLTIYILIGYKPVLFLSIYIIFTIYINHSIFPYYIHIFFHYLCIQYLYSIPHQLYTLYIQAILLHQFTSRINSFASCESAARICNFLFIPVENSLIFFLSGNLNFSHSFRNHALSNF